MTHDSVTRRSVLKATGAAAAAGIAGAAPAAASFVAGQCVVVTTMPSEAWIEGCPFSGATLPPTTGSEYTILETCYDGTDLWAKLDAGWQPWVRTSNLDYC